MKQSSKLLILAAALIVGAIAAAFTAKPAEATVRSTGPHRACRDYVAVREKPSDSPARDNLKKGQTFVVTSGVGGHYVYGYKLVNGVHGWVLSSSIDKSCP
jgi:hypothetical protein